MREIAQFFSTFFAIIVIIKTWSDYRARHESLRMFLFWTAVWLAVVVIAFFPGLFDWLVNKFGSGNTGVGTFIGMALVFILFILYRIYVKMERIEREVTKLIKDIALRKLR